MGNCDGRQSQPFIQSMPKEGKPTKVPANDNYPDAQDPENVHALVVFCDYGF
jgi:hypothetical protein